MKPLRWITVERTVDFLGHWILPLGSKAGHLHITHREPDSDTAWAVDQIGPVWETSLTGRTTLASGLTFERAVQFADAYARAGKYDNADMREAGAEWRQKPASLVQLANLIKLGIEVSA